MMTCNYTGIYLAYLITTVSENDLAFFGFMLLYDIQIFGGEILACKPVFLLTARRLDTMGPFCLCETRVWGGCLIGC